MLLECVYDYRSHFLYNQCFFHGIFTITTKEIQYNKKACVSRFYTYRCIICQNMNAL